MKRLLCKIKRQLLLVPLGFLCLSGFSKITDWGKENFKQTAQYAQPFVAAAQQFIRTVKIRNQFSVVATFDVMLMTDQMRMLYVEYYKKSHGLTKAQEASLRQRQLNENKYFISMYIVADQTDHIYINNKALFTGEYQKSPALLGNKDSMWHVHMIIAGKEYWPESIRVVDLPTEYSQCFGLASNQFSTAYLVRFSAVDDHNNYIVSPDSKSTIVLQFTSSLYQADMAWKQMTYYMK